MNLPNILKNIGLTEKESQVYLACLEIGANPVSAIAEKAGINRVTTYDTLEKLMKRGMVNSVTKDGIKYFDATNPHLVSQEVERKAKDFHKALPAFRRLRGETHLPNVSYFEGMEGLKKIYGMTLESQTEILNYSNSKEIRNYWPNYDEEYIAQRIKKKIFLRGISPLDEYGLKVKAQDKKSHREIRLVSADEFTFTNEINIWDDKIGIISFKDQPPIGVVIESMEIANTQRDIFKMAWAYAGNEKRA